MPRKAKSKIGTKKKSLKQQKEVKEELLELTEECKKLNRRVRRAAKLSESKAFIETLEKMTEPSQICNTMRLLRKPSKEPRDERLTNREKILCVTLRMKSHKKGHRRNLLASDIKPEPIDNFFCNPRSSGARCSSPTCSQFSAAFRTLMKNDFTDHAKLE